MLWSTFLSDGVPLTIPAFCTQTARGDPRRGLFLVRSKELGVRSDAVYLIDGSFYRILYRDPGILRPEDAGLWRALHVIWDGDHWGIHDDDDYLITDDWRVVAREIGWDLRRIEMRTS